MLTASYSTADMALLDTISQAPTERQKLDAIRLYRQVQAIAAKPLRLEAPRFAITGAPCAAGLGLAPGFGWDDMQPLDAPEYTPRGSVEGVTCIDRPGYVYASTSVQIADRMRWVMP